MYQSKPEAVPTFNRIAVARNVPAGRDELTVNGAGVPPHSEPVTVADCDGMTPGQGNAVEGLANPFDAGYRQIGGLCTHWIVVFR